MIVHITLNGLKVTKDIPESWDKVTFGQCLELIKAGPEAKIKALSIFTGIEMELLNKAKIHNLYPVLEILSFLDKEMEYSIPNEVMGYKIPKDLESESIAQYADIQELVKKFKEDDNVGNLSYYPLIVATYCVNPYDFKKAEELAETFLNAPCMEVMAVGNFTLARLLASKLNMAIPSLRGATRLNRLKLAMINWLYRLASTIRFYSWKKALPSPVRNYLNGR